MTLRAAVSALGLLCVAAPSAHAAAADLSSPLKLFQSVCLADQVTVSQDAVAHQSYGDLPAGAKDALGFSKPAGGFVRTAAPFALDMSDFPNAVLAVVPKKSMYLLLPAAGSGSYASSCAVVWRGNHYPEALKVAQSTALDRPLLHGMPALTVPIVGFNYAVFQNKGAIVGAAELAGWTVLRISPDLSPPAEQTNR